jgi:hypothetical protein
LSELELSPDSSSALQALAARMRAVIDTVREWAQTQRFYQNFNREWGPRHHGYELNLAAIEGLLAGHAPHQISFVDRRPTSASDWIVEFERLVRLAEEEIRSWSKFVEKTN